MHVADASIHRGDPLSRSRPGGHCFGCDQHARLAAVWLAGGGTARSGSLGWWLAAARLAAARWRQLAGGGTARQLAALLLNPFPNLPTAQYGRVLYASLTPPVTSGDGSRATVGRVRIRRKEIQPPRPAARRCTRLPPRLRSLRALLFDVSQTYGDGDAYCMRARHNCAPTLTAHAQWVQRLVPYKRCQV